MLNKAIIGKKVGMTQILDVYKRQVDAAHERGFACTGQTDDAENFAAADIEVDAVERRDPAGSAGECFVETSDANDSVLFQVHSS